MAAEEHLVAPLERLQDGPRTKAQGPPWRYSTAGGFVRTMAAMIDDQVAVSTPCSVCRARISVSGVVRDVPPGFPAAKTISFSVIVVRKASGRCSRTLRSATT